MPLTANQRIGVALAATVVVADQLSKWWITEVVMQPPRTIEILPVFNIVLGHNRGVSFGLFDNPSTYGQWVLAALALAIAAALAVWLWRTDRRPAAAALGLIIGGAIGNVIDRVTIGAVVDFLDFHWADLHWPAFNFADSAITVGAVALVLDSLFEGQENG